MGVPAAEAFDDGSLLRDAAAVLSSRRTLDGLLVELALRPFDGAAQRALCSYLEGPGVRARAAVARLRAAVDGGVGSGGVGDGGPC